MVHEWLTGTSLWDSPRPRPIPSKERLRLKTAWITVLPLCYVRFIPASECSILQLEGNSPLFFPFKTQDSSQIPMIFREPLKYSWRLKPHLWEPKHVFYCLDHLRCANHYVQAIFMIFRRFLCYFALCVCGRCVYGMQLSTKARRGR